nr:hypothetical protein BaRGS_003936 [Batillaria attramentaria]
MAITRHHDIQAIDKLTPGELASSRRERCQTHPDQFLELYCPVHFQPTCFSCYPVRHGGCGAIETAADAANRQREVVQKQMGKLKHASEEIRRHQNEITQSQQQARKDLTNLVTRLSSCLRDFEDEMLEKIQDIPVTAGLQRTCAEVEEWNWLAAAHQQLVSDTFSTANDVNMLHVSGALAARAARLAAEAPTPQDSSRVQLVVEEGAVLEVEQKIKRLAQLKTPLPALTEISSSANSRPPLQTSTTEKVSSSQTQGRHSE